MRTGVRKKCIDGCTFRTNTTDGGMLLTDGVHPYHIFTCALDLKTTDCDIPIYLKIVDDKRSLLITKNIKKEIFNKGCI